MAKATAKRKSEGALPEEMNRKYKMKNDSDVMEHEESNDPKAGEELSAPRYIKKRQAKSRKSVPVSRYDDEYEEGEGRMESQQFLALVEFESRNKKKASKAAHDFTERFNNSIQDEEQGLKKRIEKLGTAAMSNEVEFIEKFTQAFNASRPTNPPKGDSNQGKHPISNIYFSTLYSRSCKLISNARGIISQFEDANEKTTKTQVAEAFQSRWKDENESVIQMVATGHRYGLERMEAMLEGKELPVVEEEDKHLVDAIYDKGLDDGIVPWGKLAKRQLKAGKKLYKTALMAEGGS